MGVHTWLSSRTNARVTCTYVHARTQGWKNVEIRALVCLDGPAPRILTKNGMLVTRAASVNAHSCAEEHARPVQGFARLAGLPSRNVRPSPTGSGANHTSVCVAAQPDRAAREFLEVFHWHLRSFVAAPHAACLICEARTTGPTGSSDACREAPQGCVRGIQRRLPRTGPRSVGPLGRSRCPPDVLEQPYNSIELYRVL